MTWRSGQIHSTGQVRNQGVNLHDYIKYIDNSRLFAQYRTTGTGGPHRHAWKSGTLYYYHLKPCTFHSISFIRGIWYMGGKPHHHTLFIVFCLPERILYLTLLKLSRARLKERNLCAKIGEKPFKSTKDDNGTFVHLHFFYCIIYCHVRNPLFSNVKLAVHKKKLFFRQTRPQISLHGISLWSSVVTRQCKIVNSALSLK